MINPSQKVFERNCFKGTKVKDPGNWVFYFGMSGLEATKFRRNLEVRAARTRAGTRSEHAAAEKGAAH